MADEEVCWFVARTRRGQELALRKRFDELRVEYFIPTKDVWRERRGRKVRVETPLIPNMVFLHASKDLACALANGWGLPLYYIIDHRTRSMLKVPEKQMQDFRTAVNAAPESVGTDFPLTPGIRVKVIGGDLAGIEGEVLSLPGTTYVVVCIGRILCAKVSVPKELLQPVED